MRVFITGGTGFIGRHLVAELARRGHSSRVLTRGRPGAAPASEAPEAFGAFGRLDAIVGDLRHPTSYREALRGCDAVVHLAWLGERRDGRATDALLDAAAEAGVPHFLYVSCLGTGSPWAAPFFREKADIERRIFRVRSLTRTILRSSLVYGPGDRFVTGVGARLRRLPVVPEPSGRSLQVQPLFAGDLAAGICNLLEQAAAGSPAPYRIVNAGGPDVLGFADVLDLIGAAMGRLIRRVPVPWRLGTAFFFGPKGWGDGPDPAALPLFMAGASCDVEPFLEAAGLPALLPFGPGIRRYIPGG